jgi:hypothetical protein
VSQGCWHGGLAVAWYRDGTVSAGSSTNLASKRAPAVYSLPPGKRPGDIEGIGVDGFVLGPDFEKNLAETAGALFSKDAMKTAEAVANTVKSAFGGRGSICYAWYRDGTVSARSSTNLTEVREPYNYTR